MKPAENSTFKPRKTPKRDSKGKMVREREKASETRVHSLSGAILCRGIGCKVEFFPRRKDQVFCSPSCKGRFFAEARRVGTILLRDSDPKEETPIKEKNPAAVALGRLGGLKGGPARAKKLSSRKRKDIAQKAARVRWGKKDEAEVEEWPGLRTG